MLFIVTSPCNEDLLEGVLMLNKKLQRHEGGHWCGVLLFSYNLAWPIDSASVLRYLSLFMVHDYKVDIIPFYLFCISKFSNVLIIAL